MSSQAAQWQHPVGGSSQPPLPKALVFDLGGVLVDIDFDLALATWQPLSRLSLDELRRAYRIDPAYERHERGEIDARAYFAHLASVLQLSGTPQDIERGWNAIFRGEIAATRMLVERARGRLPCYAFTNTNASHMQCWTALYPAVVDAFDGIFASHQIGLRKPEREAFEHVCKCIGCAPQDVLFFDDTAQNVDAARCLGLRATLVRSPDDVASALAVSGVLR